MSTPNIFIPSNQVSEDNNESNLKSNTVNKLNKCLTTVVQFLVVATIGFLPLLFIIGNSITLSFDRIVVLSLLLGVTVVAAAVLLLFQKRIKTVLPTSLLFLLGLTVWGVISGFASGDSYDSIWGSNIGVLTVVFSVLLLATAVLPLLLQSSKTMLIRVLALVQGVSLVVLVHTLLWYWFGFSFLSFGELTSSSQSLIGGFNDSAIYAGLLVIFSLTSLVMLPLRLYAQVLVAIVNFLSIALLFLVNFSLVWKVVLAVSVVTTGYVFLRKFLFQNVSLAPISLLTKIVSAATLFFAAVALFYGATISNSLSNSASAQFIEVRPSFEASTSILREVYEEDIFLGVGPNRYEDAWRQYKNEDVNTGMFWNTNFTSGHSYVLSVFTTYGLVGGLLLVLFHLSFLWFGLNRLTANTNENLIVRYLTTTVFVGAVFLWLMTYVYTPGATVLLLAAALTGLTYAVSYIFEDTNRKTFDVVTNRVRGFVVLALVLIVIMVTCAITNGILNKYNEQINSEKAATTSDDEVMGSLANVHITELNKLIASANPESVTQEDLLEASRLALTASREAIELDPTNPIHHQRLASLYGVLGAIGVDGAYRNAKETLATVKELDPKNPSHNLATARILLAEGNVSGARAELDKALDLKANYAEAIRLQTDIAIESGETAEVISRVESAVQLEPGNPVRWYQLGLLYAVSNDTDNAVRVLLRAVSLDQSYADARYLLALQYLEGGKDERALSQLRLIQETNPNNQELQSLITSVENGESIEMGVDALDFKSVTPSVDNESGVGVPSEVSSDLFVQ